MSTGAERFVLARQGLPLASPSRRAARAPWFASFAFPRPRVSAAEPAEPLPQGALSFSEAEPSVPEDARQDDEETQTSEAAQESERKGSERKNRDGPHFPERKNRDRPHFPARSAEQRKMGSVPVFALTPHALEALTRVALKASPAVDEAPRPSPAEESAAPAAMRESPQERQIAPGNRGSAAPLARTPARQETVAQEAVPVRDGRRRLDERPVSPATISRARPSAAARRIPEQEERAAVMPMGKPAAAPQPERDAHAAVAAAVVQRRRKLERVAKAAGAAAVTRIGTVEIVVKTPPPPHAAPRAQAAPMPPAQQPGREQRKAAPFRSPWAASHWRRGD
jgi:translation initiation factor IF-2